MSCILSKMLLYNSHRPKEIDKKKAPAHSRRFSTFIRVIPIMRLFKHGCQEKFQAVSLVNCRRPWIIVDSGNPYIWVCRG